MNIADQLKEQASINDQIGVKHTPTIKKPEHKKDIVVNKRRGSKPNETAPKKL